MKNKTYILEGGRNKPNLKKVINSFCILPVCIGILTFLIIYGTTPLKVTNDNWIMAGYDEADIIQHYSGWTAYRNSDWTFPIGLAKNMGVVDSTYISYTDSIPWIAIFFKLFRNVLPKTFQYFGIYTLVCYVLQSIAAFKIVSFKTGNTIYSLIATLLFSFAPIEMERALRHTGLGSQWLILFAILIYLHHKKEYKFSHYIEIGGLMVLAIGIHPYFLPMIGVFLLLCVIDDTKHRNFISIVYMLLILVITYLAGWIIGVLGSGIETSRGGYGYYSMNVNALFNPRSCGGYQWSMFIKDFPQILGNYDGFNYLGLGIIFAVPVSFILLFIYVRKEIVIRYVKDYIFLVLGMGVCFIFAVSNVVTFNDKILWEIKLPDKLMELCGIFRASSRMFYPAYYLMYIVCILIIWYTISKINIHKAKMILALIVIIQLVDMQSVIKEKHEKMVNNADYASIVSDIQVNQLMKQSSNVLLDNFEGNNRSLAVCATKNDCKLYYSTANSGSFEKTYNTSLSIINNIKNTGKINKNAVVTTDWNVLKEYICWDDIGYYNFDSIYIIAKDTNGKLLHSAEGYMASTLSDENWKNGINLSSNTILFNKNGKLLEILQKSSKVRTSNYIADIVNIDYDENWIRVTVDKNADRFAYPEIMNFE